MSLSPPSQNRGRSSPTTHSKHRRSFLRASSERTTPPEPTKHPLPQTPPFLLCLHKCCNKPAPPPQQSTLIVLSVHQLDVC